MKVVCGLGNPGKKFEKSRHNVGFLVIDALANRYSIKVDNYNFKSLLKKIKIDGIETLLVKPLTFMNLAGEAIGNIYRHYNLQTSDIIVINDDVDLEKGRIKIARRGGDAGHLGVRSVIQALNSKDFPRCRIGIGRPSEKMDLREYVLGEFTKEEWQIMEPVILKAASAIEVIILEGIDKAMAKFN